MAIEKIQVIRDMLKIAYSRQKSYAENRRRDLEFQIGDPVYLKISPMKGVMDLVIRGSGVLGMMVLMKFCNGSQMFPMN